MPEPNLIVEIENTVKDILNAGESSVFGGAIKDKRRSAEAIAAARRKATLEVVRAVAENPNHGLWKSLAEETEVQHDAFLPPYLGAIGVPQFEVQIGEGEPVVSAGLEERPELVDAYRNDPLGLFTGFMSIAPISADGAMTDLTSGYQGYPSRTACRYSIMNNRLKFTGAKCKIPLVPFVEPNGETPEVFNNYIDARTYKLAAYFPTVVKLAMQYLIKEGDNLMPIALNLTNLGMRDLAGITSGKIRVEPLPAISELQRLIQR